MASLDKVQVDGNSYTIDATTLNGRPASDYLLKSEVYPVGSIYISLNSANPSSIFGGTWEQIQGRFLLGASGSHPVNQTGGEETHTLSEGEMPYHTHGPTSGSRFVSVDGEAYGSLGNANAGYINVTWNNWSTTPKGSSQPHNNMPPYLAVYMWKRTA